MLILVFLSRYMEEADVLWTDGSITQLIFKCLSNFRWCQKYRWLEEVRPGLTPDKHLIWQIQRMAGTEILWSFVKFRKTAKLDKEEGIVQVSSLIYTMESKAEKLYFCGHLRLPSTLCPEVTRKHVQGPGEKVKTFIRALYQLSAYCIIVASQEENIRHRIVVIILDKDLSTKLQLEGSDAGADRWKIAGVAYSGLWNHRGGTWQPSGESDAPYTNSWPEATTAVSRAQSGVWPDPDKVEAIRQLSPPANVQKRSRVLGMMNYLERYIPNLSTVGQPPYKLLKNKKHGHGDIQSKQPFKILRNYDLSKPTAVLQLIRSHWWPSLSATVWTKCQPLLTRLTRFNRGVQYVPGNTLVVKDTLSHSPLANTGTGDTCWGPHNKRCTINGHKRHNYLVISVYYSRFLERLHMHTSHPKAQNCLWQVWDPWWNGQQWTTVLEDKV